MYVLIVSLRVKEEMRDTFSRAAQHNAEASLQDEEGCLRFDIVEMAGDPVRFLFYEVYRDKTAFDQHRQTSHYLAWRAALRQFPDIDGTLESWAGSLVWPSDRLGHVGEHPGEGAAGALAGLHVIMRRESITPVERGTGVTTRPYVGPWNTSEAGITSGVTTFLPGTGLPLHTHNVEEQVMVLDGHAEVEIGGDRTLLGPGDSTWAAAGVIHRYAADTENSLRIFWVYRGVRVTRTVCATGETVEHLSPGDRLATHT